MSASSSGYRKRGQTVFEALTLSPENTGVQMMCRQSQKGNDGKLSLHWAFGRKLQAGTQKSLLRINSDLNKEKS